MRQSDEQHPSRALPKTNGPFWLAHLHTSLFAFFFSSFDPVLLSTENFLCVLFVWNFWVYVSGRRLLYSGDFFFWGLSFWVFTYVTRKMTHFNKGPSYGLSAEVRSKVSACKGGLGSAGLKSLQTFNLTDSNSLFWFLNKFPSTVSFAFSSFFSLRHTTQWRGWGCPNFTKASISNFPFAHSLLGRRRTIL